MAFWHKSNKRSNPIFLIFSDFFRFLDFSRLSDSTALLKTHNLPREKYKDEYLHKKLGLVLQSYLVWNGGGHNGARLPACRWMDWTNYQVVALRYVFVRPKGKIIAKTFHQLIVFD